MPKLNHLLFAEGWSVDSDTNRLSVFNIIEGLFPRRFPARVNRLVGIAEVAFSEAELNQDYQVSLEVVRPGCEVEKPFSANMRSEAAEHVAIMRLRNMPIAQHGNLLFRLRINGELLTERTLIVHDPSEGLEDEDMFRYPKPSSKDNKKSTRAEVDEEKRSNQGDNVAAQPK